MFPVHAFAVPDIGCCVCTQQGVLQQLVDGGALAGLPEDAQWSARMLLPRKGEGTPQARAPPPAVDPAPAAADAAAAGPSGAGGPNAAALLSLLMQPVGLSQRVTHLCKTMQPWKSFASLLWYSAI